MEKDPDITNVAYIDEYPHLEERLRLQRLARPAVRAALHDMKSLLIFERPEPPDGVAWLFTNAPVTIDSAKQGNA